MKKNMGDSSLILDVLRAHFGDDGGRMHTGVEVGVHRGATSAKLLEAFPRLVLFMVDPYATYAEDHPYRKTGDSISRMSSKEQKANAAEARRVTSFAEDRRMLIIRPSPQAVQFVPAPCLSFAFLDGDHSYEAVARDIAAWWPRVEAGGLLAGHDFGHPREGRGFGVKAAVEEFSARENLPFDLIGSVWFIEKPIGDTPQA